MISFLVKAVKIELVLAPVARYSRGRLRSAWRDGDECTEAGECRETLIKRRNGGKETREDLR
jgi:hypothetical protein